MIDIIRKRESPNQDAVLEKRFISRILGEELKEFEQNQVKLMSSRGFTTNEFYTGRFFNVSGNIAEYKHPVELRFIDMKKRQTKTGVKKKAFHPIHNAPLFGMANNILQRLSFEYTEQMKDLLLNSNP